MVKSLQLHQKDFSKIQKVVSSSSNISLCGALPSPKSKPSGPESGPESRLTQPPNPKLTLKSAIRSPNTRPSSPMFSPTSRPTSPNQDYPILKQVQRQFPSQNPQVPSHVTVKTTWAQSREPKTKTYKSQQVDVVCVFRFRPSPSPSVWSFIICGRRS